MFVWFQLGGKSKANGHVANGQMNGHMNGEGDHEVNKQSMLTDVSVIRETGPYSYASENA